MKRVGPALTFFRPSGAVLPDVPEVEPIDTVGGLTARQQHLGIDHETMPRWAGEAMDYGLAVEHLLLSGGIADV